MAFDPKAVLERLSADAPRTFELTATARAVLESRYLLRNEQGGVIETQEELLSRVSQAAAAPERESGTDPDLWAGLFRLTMLRKEFLPNTPTLTNAGRPAGQLAACFVLPVGDSAEAVSETVREMALVQKTGGGTGFSFSNLRPAADPGNAGGVRHAGPVRCMEAFDAATDRVKQTGMRRGANMGILSVDHPDVVEFVSAKLHPDRLTNFNLSVAVTDTFMDRAERGQPYPLVDPQTGTPASNLDARRVLELISNLAWQVGDPGVIFIDTINRTNPTPHLGEVESTNPCGELPLLPYESCNLGSINLARFVRDNKDLDWERLKAVVWVAVRFLDNIIDANAFPLQQIRAQTLKSRKIGLGVMGFADALILLNVSYTDPAALKWAGRIMEFVATESKRASAWLAGQRGPCPAVADRLLKNSDLGPVRNATTNTVAPTGTLSVLAGCSASIEPLFGLAYTRHILEGRRFEELHPLLEPVAGRFGVWSDRLKQHVERTGSLTGFDGLPEQFTKLFPVAHQIPYAHHIKMQAAFQQHVDNSVSKTINLPHDAAPREVEDAIRLAWKLDCKGLTVYRDKSRAEQVLRRGVAETDGSDQQTAEQPKPFRSTCPECGHETFRSSGCAVCRRCAWSDCR
jgi:ribonucleoside-diphosphate reductase alpha chain